MTLTQPMKAETVKAKNTLKAVSRNHLLISQIVMGKYCSCSGIDRNQVGRFIENAITKFIKSIDKCFFSSQRKSTFKEEFVSCGGT
jgi:hypothetical protein